MSPGRFLAEHTSREIGEWMAWHKLEAADRKTTGGQGQDSEQGQRQATQVGAGITRPFSRLPSSHLAGHAFVVLHGKCRQINVLANRTPSYCVAERGSHSTAQRGISQCQHFISPS